MPIYATAERKSVSTSLIASGGELIEVAPYFAVTGYTDFALRTNTTTSEHVSKFVEVAAGYSLEPIGKITYQKSTYSNAKQTKLELATVTTGLSLNLFMNQFNLISNFNFPYTAAYVNDQPFVVYSSLFSKTIVNITPDQYTVYWYICPPDFSTRTQIFTSNSSTYALRFICETSSILLISESYINYLTTTDGTNFITRSLPVQIYGVASNTSVFVFHAFNGTIYTSPDGVTLTSRGNQGAITSDNSIAFGNGIFAIISSASVAKTSSDNGVNWVSKTLPETINWRSIVFDATHNVFILAAASKNYFYITTDFNSFTQIYLPFTLTEVRAGKMGNLTVINGYISKDLKAWIKPNISNLYLRSVKNPPIYNIGNAVTTNVKTYELRSDLFYSPPNQTNTTNVNAFVRTALD